MRRYVASIDVDADCARLHALLGQHLRPECLMTLRISHLMVQRGVKRGLSLFEIASLMCRSEFSADPAVDLSPLERAVLASAHLATHAMHSVDSHVAKRLRGLGPSQLRSEGVAKGGSPPAVSAPLLPTLQRTPPLESRSVPGERAAGVEQPPALLLPMGASSLGRQLSSQPTFSACPAAVAAWWAARTVAAVPHRASARIRCRHISELGAALGVSASSLGGQGVDVWVAAAFTAENASMESWESAGSDASSASRITKLCASHECCGEVYHAALLPAEAEAISARLGLLRSHHVEGAPEVSWAAQFGFATPTETMRSLLTAFAVAATQNGRLLLSTSIGTGRAIAHGHEEVTSTIRTALAAALAFLSLSVSDAATAASAVAVAVDALGFGEADFKGEGSAPSLDIPRDISDDGPLKAHAPTTASAAAFAHVPNASSAIMSISSPYLQRPLASAADPASDGAVAVYDHDHSLRLSIPLAVGEARLHAQPPLTWTGPLPLPQAVAWPRADSSPDSLALAHSQLECATDSATRSLPVSVPATRAPASEPESASATSTTGTASGTGTGTGNGGVDILRIRQIAVALAPPIDLRMPGGPPPPVPGTLVAPSDCKTQAMMASDHHDGTVTGALASESQLLGMSPDFRLNMLARSSSIFSSLAAQEAADSATIFAIAQRAGASAGATALRALRSGLPDAGGVPESCCSPKAYSAQSSATIVHASIGALRPGGVPSITILRECMRRDHTGDNATDCGTSSVSMAEHSTATTVSASAASTPAQPTGLLGMKRVGRLDAASALPSLPECFEPPDERAGSSQTPILPELPQHSASSPLPTPSSTLALQRPPPPLSLARAATYDSSSVQRTYARDALRGLAGTLPSTLGTPLSATPASDDVKAAGDQEIRIAPSIVPSPASLSRHASESGVASTNGARTPQATYDDAFLHILALQVDELITKKLESRKNPL